MMLRYFLIAFLALSILDGQEIKKGGKKNTKRAATRIFGEISNGRNKTNYG